MEESGQEDWDEVTFVNDDGVTSRFETILSKTAPRIGFLEQCKRQTWRLSLVILIVAY